LSKLIFYPLIEANIVLSSQLLSSLLRLASSHMDFEFAGKAIKAHHQLHGSLDSSHYEEIVIMLAEAKLPNETMEALRYMPQTGITVNTHAVQAVTELLEEGNSTLNETKGLLYQVSTSPKTGL
jgi:hypothetical protein